MTIPFVNLKSQYQEIMPNVKGAIQRVLDSGTYILGPEVEAFEEEFANYCHAKHAVAVANGTDAIAIGLKAMGVKPNEYVITAANTFIATTEAIASIGAKVALVDVEPDTLLLSPRLIEEEVKRLQLSGSTIGAIVPVHLYGNYCNMPDIKDIARKFGIKILEDSAQAHGAKLHSKGVGAWGDVATFSFYPGKNLGAYGDAGAIVTNDDSIAEYAKMLRNHGRRTGDKYEHRIAGYNSRMDAFQGAILREKLKFLNRWTENRIAAANLYRELLQESSCTMTNVREGVSAVYHLFVIQLANREIVQKKLRDRNIYTGIHYPKPIYALEAYVGAGFHPKDFPVTEAASRRILSLPICGNISMDQVRHVCNVLEEVLNS